MSENASTTTTTYSADFICTYKLMDNDDDRNIMYQIQILQAFGMQNFDQDEINEKVLHLYQKLIDKGSKLKEKIDDFSTNPYLDIYKETNYLGIKTGTKPLIEIYIYTQPMIALFLKIFLAQNLKKNYTKFLIMKLNA